jgi:FkbM family methyltransferase
MSETASGPGPEGPRLTAAEVMRALRRGRPVAFRDISVTRAVVRGTAMNFCWRHRKDTIQAHNRQGLFYEADELDLIAKHFPAGGVFVDIGANVGNHSLFVAKFLSPSRVIPVEPNPEIIDLLLANIVLNDVAARFDLSCIGIGASDGAEDGFGMGASGSNIGAARMVAGAGGIAVRSGDSILSDIFPSMIKIDVEGMEMQVLRGLSETLARSRPALFVEVDTANDAEFLNWCSTLHYRVEATTKRYRANANGPNLVRARHRLARLGAALRASRTLDARIFHFTCAGEITSLRPWHRRRPFPGSPCSW